MIAVQKTYNRDDGWEPKKSQAKSKTYSPYTDLVKVSAGIRADDYDWYYKMREDAKRGMYG